MEKKLFHCTNCNSQFPRWMGQCQECGSWGSVEEISSENQQFSDEDSKIDQDSIKEVKTKQLDEISTESTDRIDTHLDELNRVLGGGLVPGSLTLLGGEPGIGKSTLALQIANQLEDVLYVSGEESLGQIKIRADRLNLNSELKLANETEVNSIISEIKKEEPKLAIIDSIQTLHANDVDGKRGHRKQIRACTSKLIELAKSTNIPVVLIGHVTKEGHVAGPKTLEHMVDIVLYLEGDKNRSLRMLRGIKNRFGATNEVGVFEMMQEGLKQVKNPSSTLLEEREEDMTGSVATCMMEGTRPILIEVQALVNKTVFGNPARKASGFDLSRLHVLTAVLQKRAKLNLAEYDVHINIVGGLEASEPAVDLAVCFAIASAYNDKPLSKELAVFGEVGLGGEVRSVSSLDKRIKECSKLGMEKVITKVNQPKETDTDITINSVKNIQELVQKT